jgi:hypothetical protein
MLPPQKKIKIPQISGQSITELGQGADEVYVEITGKVSCYVK